MDLVNFFRPYSARRERPRPLPFAWYVLLLRYILEPLLISKNSAVYSFRTRTPNHHHHHYDVTSKRQLLPSDSPLDHHTHVLVTFRVTFSPASTFYCFVFLINLLRPCFCTFDWSLVSLRRFFLLHLNIFLLSALRAHISTPFTTDQGVRVSCFQLYAHQPRIATFISWTRPAMFENSGRSCF